MSNLIYGNIICDSPEKIIPSHIDVFLINFCVNNNFAIHFLNVSPTVKEEGCSILFQISDNFLIHHCDNFLEPIVYTPDGNPLVDNLSKDIEKIYGLIKILFSFNVVKFVELRFSFVEVDENEYEVCNVCVENLKNTILQKYLGNVQVPVVKFVIER